MSKILLLYETPCKNCGCGLTECKGQVTGKMFYFHPNNARNCECGCKKPEPKEDIVKEMV